MGHNHTGTLNSLDINNTTGARIQFTSTGIKGYESTSVLRWEMKADGTPLTVYGEGGNSQSDAALKFINGGHVAWISAGSSNSDLRYDAAYHQFHNFTGNGYITGIQSISMDKTSGVNSITGADVANFQINHAGSSGDFLLMYNGGIVMELDATNTTHYNHVIPSVDGNYRLGAFNLKWQRLYADYVGSSYTRISHGYFTSLTSTNAVTVDSWSKSKENIASYSGNALSILDGVDVISFSHLADRDPSGRIKLGVRAESFQEPMALVNMDYGHDLGDGPALDTMGLLALVVKAIQELRAEVVALGKNTSLS